ncbi:MAG: hypothetical protein QOI11_2971 [Candidatus Eremiobacteraeota bacterium]|nr:hypothetical protein [Candidatus Eremiobacteraeota bacterium]
MLHLRPSLSGRAALIAGSVALALLVLLVDHALPAVTLAPLGAISVLGIAVAAGPRWSTALAVMLAVLFAASLTSGVGVVFEAAVFALSYVLSIMLLSAAQRQAARAAALTHERRAAQGLHDELVPRAIPPLHGWRFDVAHLPFEDVGGDFFDALADGDGLALFFGDVSGKGMRAAMLLSALKLIVRGTPARASGAVLAELNRYLAPLGRDGTFCTAWHGRFAPDGRVRFAIAGHEPPLHLRADGSVAELPVGGIPLGVSEGETFPEFELALEAGEAIAVYSDGLSELFAAGIAPADVFAPGPALAERLRALPRRDDVLIVIATRESAARA